MPLLIEKIISQNAQEAVGEQWCWTMYVPRITHFAKRIGKKNWEVINSSSFIHWVSHTTPHHTTPSNSKVTNSFWIPFSSFALPPNKQWSNHLLLDPFSSFYAALGGLYNFSTIFLYSATDTRYQKYVNMLSILQAIHTPIHSKRVIQTPSNTIQTSSNIHTPIVQYIPYM